MNALIARAVIIIFIAFCNLGYASFDRTVGEIIQLKNKKIRFAEKAVGEKMLPTGIEPVSKV